MSDSVKSAFSEVTLRNMTVEELRRHGESDNGCLMELGRRAIACDWEAEIEEMKAEIEKLEERLGYNEHPQCPECGAQLSNFDDV